MSGFSNDGFQSAIFRYRKTCHTKSLYAANPPVVASISQFATHLRGQSMRRILRLAVLLCFASTIAVYAQK